METPKIIETFVDAFCDLISISSMYLILRRHPKKILVTTTDRKKIFERSKKKTEMEIEGPETSKYKKYILSMIGLIVFVWTLIEYIDPY
jgi:hypothetical protein